MKATIALPGFDCPRQWVRAYHATLDPDGKVGAWEPIDIRGGNDGWNPAISFSPDGGQIAYASGDDEKAGKDLVLRNLKTGQEQVLYWFNSGQPVCHFAYDLPKVFCSVGWDENGGHSDPVSVSTKSGAVEKLASFPDHRGQPISSIDSQRICFPAQKAHQDGNYLRWERSIRQDTLVGAVSNNHPQFYVPTQDERWLIRKDDQGLAIRPMSGGDWRVLVSTAVLDVVRFVLGSYYVPTPDERWLIRDDLRGLSARSMSGGDWRVLVSAGADARVDDAVASDDWVLFAEKDPEGKIRLYRIPISGGEPLLLGDFPSNSKPEEAHIYLQLSRDARQIIAVSKDKSKFNLWTLENFEPLSQKQ
jgi:hypothetical protein